MYAYAMNCMECKWCKMKWIRKRKMNLTINPKIKWYANENEVKGNES